MKKSCISQGTANCGKSSARKDIYVLLGNKHCGKSSTIKEIYRILSIKYPNCIIPNKTKKYGYDMKIAMKIEVGTEKVLIGIDSHGDIKNRVKRSLNYFANIGCNIIFCAESLPNDTVRQWVKSHSYNIISIPIPQKKFIGKNITQAKANYETAKNIINQAHL
ncbi:hypothetical protein R83H12_01753 [Fibrobacteria bacterium R8-3-H12]